jgi:hypothetical protein
MAERGPVEGQIVHVATEDGNGPYLVTATQQYEDGGSWVALDGIEQEPDQ